MPSSPLPAEVHALFRARVASIPEALSLLLSSNVDWPTIDKSLDVWVTGVGASEGPSRLLAMLLLDAGYRARFVPLSTFAIGVGGSIGPCSLDALAVIVLSQGLSPNARLALTHAAKARAALLVTSVSAQTEDADARAALRTFVRAGGRVARIPPERESGTLARLVGPTVALLAVSLFAASLGNPVEQGDLASIPDLAKSSAARVEEVLKGVPRGALHERVAFVIAGPWMEAYRGLSCLWIEGLGAPEPALWDVLGVAHGPFHQFYGDAMTLVSLEHRGIAGERDLFDRLQTMLAPERHTLIRLVTELSPPLGAIDHQLLVIALLMRAIDERSWDIGGAVGKDAPLYGIGDER